jgi:pyruvate dehydrogenase E1 component beta subunit
VAGAQHSELLEGWFAQVPGLKVVIPSDPFEAKGLLLASIQDEDPVLFIESMTITQSLEVPERGEPIPLGKANIRRCGTDVTVIGYGHVVGMIEEAAANLTGEGISVEIVDPRTLVPLDAETIVQSVAKSRRAVVVTASIRSFGPGAEIAALIHEQLFSELLAPVKRVGGRAIPMPFSPALVMANYVTVPEIEAAIREVVK